jgi:hypothetical protein
MSMVRITIFGGPDHGTVARYDDGANRKEVLDVLLISYGKGHLEQNGNGVLSETLTGEYQYVRTGIARQGAGKNSFLCHSYHRLQCTYMCTINYMGSSGSSCDRG